MHFLLRGRDSSVGIATLYELDGPRIASRWPDRPWGSPSLLYNGNRGFPVGKMAVAWRWSITVSNAEVKERVGLYVYYASGLSCPVIGWNLPLSSYLSEINGHSVSFLRVKQPVHGINHQPPLVEVLKKSRAKSLKPPKPRDFVAFFRVKFTSQKTVCICISETEQWVSSKEVISSICVGSCKIHRICFVG